MPIIVIDSHYPPSINQDVLTTWLGAMEKYPRPEDLFKTLIQSAVSSNYDGLRVFSAFQTNPGKYEEAAAYFTKFMTSFFHIEDYYYEMSTWATIEEAMESIGAKMPERS
ncbi:MAG: hypothetical protein HF981_08000 [Desulfobacteraceae bacterium]|nr:hypothetical protein [Desulfobacteraceae bacterium]MBC2750311.1 hypothetical protein [Desulfobacteraceae bacterium]